MKSLRAAVVNGLAREVFANRSRVSPLHATSRRRQLVQMLNETMANTYIILLLITVVFALQIHRSQCSVLLIVDDSKENVSCWNTLSFFSH